MNNALAELLFDRTAPDDGPNVGAFIRGGSDGAVISNTGTSLDVNVTSPISVEVDAADGDNVAISDGVDTLGINADGSLNAVVSATDLDIRNLSHTQDSVKVGDGVDFLAVNADGSINVNATLSATQVEGKIADDAVDTVNPVKVGSHAYNQASALAAISGAGDLANLASDLYRRVFVNDSAAVGLKATKVAVTDAGESALPTTALPGRTRMLVKNMGPKIAYVGKAGDAAANGYPLSKGESVGLEAGQAIALVSIAETGGTAELRVFELA